MGKPRQDPLPLGTYQEKTHKIKHGVGAGPRNWVGISPEGHVLVTGDDGHTVDEGPADSYYRQGEGVSMSKILAVLAILGLSILLAVERAAAILDPEPASKRDHSKMGANSCIS